MNEKLLISLGLTSVQAEILSCLLENKAQRASNIAKKTKRPRGVVYKGLEELISLKLASKKDGKAGITIFSAEHPANLEQILDKKEKDLAKAKSDFNSFLPDLVSAYNLISNKPGVKFYEGEEGLRKVLEDTLTSKTEICLLLNRESLNKEETFKEVNALFKKKREQLGIKKKIIRIEREPLHEPNTGLDYEKITAIRYLDKTCPPFKSSIQIYDNKISFQVINQEQIISIIIEDKNIYEMNKFIFDCLWEEAGRKII
jgi:sugar-specific transcriptional regulator TrmB